MLHSQETPDLVNAAALLLISAGVKSVYAPVMSESGLYVLSYYGSIASCNICVPAIPFPAEPDMHDIGILASFDPVAVDQACIDLVYSAEGGASLIQRIESRNGLLTLEHTEEIGLGNRTYELVSIDE